jgi:hypothetical protein
MRGNKNYEFARWNSLLDFLLERRFSRSKLLIRYKLSLKRVQFRLKINAAWIEDVNADYHTLHHWIHGMLDLNMCFCCCLGCVQAYWVTHVILLFCTLFCGLAAMRDNSWWNCRNSNCSIRNCENTCTGWSRWPYYCTSCESSGPCRRGWKCYEGGCSHRHRTPGSWERSSGRKHLQSPNTLHCRVLLIL